MLVASDKHQRGGFRLSNLHNFWDTERLARLGVPLEAADERK
jgi:hypothetical protein